MTSLFSLPLPILETKMFDFISRRFSSPKEYRVTYRDSSGYFFMVTLVTARSEYEANRKFDQDERFLSCVRLDTSLLATEPE